MRLTRCSKWIYSSQLQNQLPGSTALCWLKVRTSLETLKLCICMDPMNLNKAIIREPYHFKMPDDIAHLIAGS